MSSDTVLVLGLGNPGDRYAGTRHNVGTDAVELLAARFGGRLRPDTKTSARVDEVRIGSRRVALAVPTTWMNESGQAAAALVRRYHLDDWSQLVVVHDELDLPPGRVKLKSGGGLAGHNGLRSLTQHLKTQDYLRVRIGVGRPPGGPDKGADWVLSKVPRAARTEIDVGVVTAADAVEKVVVDGIDAAMLQFHTD
ncbi:MAG: aminoacyl-tRNA hydrolase [Actinomycetes bacterium]